MSGVSCSAGASGTSGASPSGSSATSARASSVTFGAQCARIHATSGGARGARVGGAGRTGPDGGWHGRFRAARDDFGAPRRISLPMEASSAPSEDAQTEPLSPMEELARKLEELKRRIARPED